MSAGAVATISAGLVFALGLPFVCTRHGQEAEPASTYDVQDFDRLWRDLRALQADAAELEQADFLRTATARTAAYLRFEDEQETQLLAATEKSLQRLADARARKQAAEKELVAAGDPPTAVARRQDTWRRWQEEQQAAADELLDDLQPTDPRRELLAQRRLDWLLRVEYGVLAANTGSSR